MKLGAILNTRPISESNRTIDAFKKQGFEAISFPCLEIAPVNNLKESLSQLKSIQPYTVIVFTSIQAVVHAFKLVPDWKISKDSVVLTVGSNTAQQLKKYINNKIYVPQLHNSEGIIDFMDKLKSIKSIALITAENGRQEIQKHCRNNNIELSQIYVYQRLVPTNNQVFDELTQGSSFSVLATSVVTLKNLNVLLDKSQWEGLKNTLIVCASDRIENFAHEMGLKYTLNTNSANPKHMAQKLFTFVSGLKEKDRQL